MASPWHPWSATAWLGLLSGGLSFALGWMLRGRKERKARAVAEMAPRLRGRPVPFASTDTAKTMIYQVDHLLKQPPRDG